MALADDLADAVRTFSARHQIDGRTRWVMGRGAYDRLRAVLVTEDQECARAQAHATTLISDDPPHACPVCASGPYATAADLASHIAAMADVTNREPHDGDTVLGIRIEVREDAGEPHLQQLVAPEPLP